MSSSTSGQAFDLQQIVHPRRTVGLWRLMTGFRLCYLGATLSLGVAATTRMATYQLIRFLVDNVLADGTRLSTQLPLVALGFVALALIQGVFTFLSGRWAALTAEGIARRLRNYLFDHIQRLPFHYHDQAQTGDLVQRSTSDVEALRLFFADQATSAGRILFLFAVNLIALLRLNAPLALFSIVVVPLVVLISLLFFRRISRTYEDYQEQESALTTTLQENLAGVRVVKAFARQAYEREKFEGQNWYKFTLGRRLMSLHALFWPTTDVLAGLQMLAGFYLAARMVMNGTLTIGEYLAYAGMIIWIIWPMRNLGRLIVHISFGLVSFSRVVEILKARREPIDVGEYRPAGPPRGEIVFEDVCFEYATEATVLHGISFRVQPGQVVALLGSTGSGKSTLVNLLPRFYEYSDGSLTLDGVELKRYPRRYLRQHIGSVEQEPFLFSRTLRENIAYGVDRQVSQAEIEAAARAAAIHDVIISFPDGYDTLVGERGVTLSGGQKQRLAIARTLLKDPRILILDDSTSSVDTETEAAIRQALERLMQGRTTFVIAHRVQSLMNADLILVLEDGQIVQRGTHATLIDKPGFYRQIYALQTRIEIELEMEVTGARV